MTITIDLPTDWEGQLKKAARRQGKDVAVFLTDGIREQLRHDILPESEAALLETINAPLAPEARRLRDSLLVQQKERELTLAEQSLLFQTIDAVEMANARRWKAIAELAGRRGLSLYETMAELGIGSE